jgi:hypothetical protein
MAFAATTMPASAATPPDPTGLTGTPGNFWVNHTWDADTTGVTDSYNLSVNGAPQSTTNEYWNVTYSAHAWQNLTVYAFNDTDGLSTGSLSQKTQIPNNPITITGISDAAVNVGAPVHVDCNADDDDAGDVPTFSCNRTDLFAFNPTTGVGDWTPSTSGTYYVDFGVSDGHGSTDNTTMTITVNAAATTTPPTPNLQNTTGRYWVKYEWSKGSGGGDTDSYNVSMNGKWTNTTSTSRNVTPLSPSGWANISVRAYNKSGNGNLSAPVSRSVQAPAPPRGYDTGNRIWEQGMNTSYLWTAQTFTGFYYDIDDGLSTETLTITGIDRSLSKESIVYETIPRAVKFDRSSWGTYEVVGFMAEKYFAGYVEGEVDKEITDETISLVSNKILSKVLIDEDDKHMVSTGASLELKKY